MEAVIIVGAWAKNPTTLTMYMTEAELRDLKQAVLVIHNQRSQFKGLSSLESFAWQDFRNALFTTSK